MLSRGRAVLSTASGVEVAFSIRAVYICFSFSNFCERFVGLHECMKFESMKWYFV